jgi:hypothetical protein
LDVCGRGDDASTARGSGVRLAAARGSGVRLAAVGGSGRCGRPEAAPVERGLEFCAGRAAEGIRETYV